MCGSHIPLGCPQKRQPLSMQTHQDTCEQEVHTHLHVMKADPQLFPHGGFPSHAELSCEGCGVVPASPILWIPTEREWTQTQALGGRRPSSPKKHAGCLGLDAGQQYPESDCVRYTVGHLLQLTHSHKENTGKPHPRIHRKGSLEKRKK